MKNYLFLLAAPVLLMADQTQTNDPFAAVQQLQHEMDAAMARLQKQMTNESGSGNVMNLSAGMTKVDLKSEGDHYTLSMAIPGASEKSIDIKTEDRIVTVTAERDEVRDGNTSNHDWQERRVSSYTSSVAVPDDAETDHMKTDYKNGILTITMPKKTA